jgi:putative transposase
MRKTKIPAVLVPGELDALFRSLHHILVVKQEGFIADCRPTDLSHQRTEDEDILGEPWGLVARYNKYYEGKKPVLDADSPELQAVRERLRDFSCLLKDLQQLFTGWYNRTRPVRRRGGLWADRFKSVLLDGETALWSCMKYVELNPFRAGMVDDPADYRFCSWGVWAQSGRHPFASAFFAHVRKSRGPHASKWSLKQLQAELRADMGRTMAAESGAETKEMVEAYEEEGQKQPTLVLQATRRLRYWSDGAVIGSKLFVEGVAAELYGQDRARKRRYGKGALPDSETVVFSLRCLRGDLIGPPREPRA